MARAAHRLLSRRLLLSCAAGLLVPQPADALALLRVAAASDVRGPLEELRATFELRQRPKDPKLLGGVGISVTYGSTGNLARQIEQGAPFLLFLAADERHALELAAKGLTAGEGFVYATGRLSLIVPKARDVLGGQGLAGLTAAIADGRIMRFAIANPEHAPYGERAREVLQRNGLWALVQGRIVLGENVAQAAQMVATGAADAGIVARSLTKTVELAAATIAADVAADQHSALRQRVVLLRGAAGFARGFYDFLQSAEARAVFVAYGLDQP